MSLSTVVPLNGKFPSLGSTVSHSVSYPTLRGRIASVVRLLGRSSVNDPSITRIISFATHYRQLTSNSQSVPSKACSLQSLFSFLHHPDCLYISPIAGFVDDNAGSQGHYTPLSFLLVSLHLVLLLLFFKLLYTHFSLSFRQHFANTFTLSSILHSPFFSIILPDICEEEVTTTSVEMLNWWVR